MDSSDFLVLIKGGVTGLSILVVPIEPFGNGNCCSCYSCCLSSLSYLESNKLITSNVTPNSF